MGLTPLEKPVSWWSAHSVQALEIWPDLRGYRIIKTLGTSVVENALPAFESDRFYILTFIE